MQKEYRFNLILASKRYEMLWRSFVREALGHKEGEVRSLFCV